MQALMFAMYFAAITSLTAEECMVIFREQKQQLLARYRFGTEQALVQADILNSMEMVTLQALVIYLVRTIPRGPHTNNQQDNFCRTVAMGI